MDSRLALSEKAHAQLRELPREQRRLIDPLQERLEDLEDLRDLELAMTENGRTPLVPWEKAKKELGLA